MLHANFIVLFFIEPELLQTKRAVEQNATLSGLWNQSEMTDGRTFRRVLSLE